MKFQNNPLFWGCFFSLLCSAAAVNSVSGVQALNLVFFCFLAWLLLRMFQRSFIQREELFPARPYGVLSAVSGVPFWVRWGCWLMETSLCIGFCCFYHLWMPAIVTGSIALAFAWLGYRKA